jgi:hypothetical protein
MTVGPVPDFASVFDVPAEVGAVVREFRSCEFSTLARDGTPVTWPTVSFFEAEQRRFLITSSIGLAQKALNVRRDPRVAMLFSNPTGSGLVSPPQVLIEGGRRGSGGSRPNGRAIRVDDPADVRAATRGHHVDGRAPGSAASPRGLVLLAGPHLHPATADPLVVGT